MESPVVRSPDKKYHSKSRNYHQNLPSVRGNANRNIIREYLYRPVEIFTLRKGNAFYPYKHKMLFKKDVEILYLIL